MMPSRLRNKLLFVTAVMSFLFTLFLPSYSGASNYSYDNGNRLIRVAYENGSKIEYSYDESGNRTQSLTTSIAATSLQVTVKSDAQNALPGIHLYLFNDTGSYLNLTQVTNASGAATFPSAPGGSLKQQKKRLKKNLQPPLFKKIVAINYVLCPPNYPQTEMSRIKI